MKKSFKAAAQVSVAAVIAMTSVAPVSAETLKEALAAAYMSNPQLDAQRAALRATDETVRQAKSAYMPRIDANFDQTFGQAQVYQVDDELGPFIIGDEDNDGDGRNDPILGRGDYFDIPRGNQTLTVQQNVFRGFRTHNEIQQAKSNVFAGRAQLKDIEQQVLLQAAQAYMDVYRDEATRELNENNVRVLERQLEASRDRFRVGEITRTDVAQSEARLEVAKAQLLQSEAALEASRATFQQVVGRTPAGTETPDELSGLPANLDDAVELALTNDPGVQQARELERAASKGVDVAKGTLLPTVTVQGRLNRNEGTNAFGTLIFSNIQNARTVSVNVAVPIWQGGQNHSEIRRQKQIRSQRMLEIRNAENIARAELLTAWNNYRAAQGQITSQNAAVRANEIALDGVRQEANVGSRTTLDVLDAEQELLQSRVNLVGARRDRVVAGYQLLSALGQLTARDQGLGVELYDPEENYDKNKNRFIGW